jgi:hypothetical protein
MRRANAAEIAELLAPRFPDVPETHRIRAIARYQALALWPPDPRFPLEAFDRLGAAMLSCGAIAHIPPFEDCVDQVLVEEALAQ